MRINRGIVWCVAAFAAATGFLGRALATIQTPLQLNQPAALINWQSLRGVPLSTTNGNPVGSDGRGPTLNAQTAQGLDGNIAGLAVGNFSTFVAFGGVVIPNGTAPTASTFAGSAVGLGLPLARSNGVVSMVVTKAQVGAPYIVQSSGYLFGQVITPPATDESGNALPAGVTPASYWRAEPYTTNGHVGDRFYWSPNAQQVFASQSGQVTVQWRKANPEYPTPSTATMAANPGNYETEGNYVYRLLTTTTVVSGSAVKSPLTIFWNQGAFSRIGTQILVPAGAVVGINVITNNAFPIRVTNSYVLPGQVAITTSNLFQETRTLWFDEQGGSINAYNQEGRVLVEYYGNLNADGVSHQFLGYDVVDVRQKADINVTQVNLGDPLMPNGPGATTLALSPRAIKTTDFSTDVYTLGSADSDSTLQKYWAVQEVGATNEVLVYWLQKGTLGIQWPVLLDTYIQAWPTNLSLYSQYIRPNVANASAAAATGIQLPSLEAPTLVYQDPLDQPRGFIDSSFRFYSWLTPAYPAHRALIQYNVGNRVWFERVFSWLDTAAQTGADALASSVSTNLVNPGALNVGKGTGLKGQYYGAQPNGAIPGEDSFYSGVPTLTRVDPTVNFNWSLTGPDPSVGQVNFAVKWTGLVQAQFSETYTFYGGADDGVRVIVNGRTLVDKWIPQGYTEYSGTIDLVAGQVYPIEMIYFQGGGGAAASLGWSSPSTSKQIIPSSQLYNSNDRIYQPVLPSVVRQNVLVGQRVTPPSGEIGALPATNYLAGHINPLSGTFYATDAYVDPIATGFAAANLSSIIPVNATPANNTLEVWWYRQSSAPAGQGFEKVYWPSVLGYYTVGWPNSTPDKIVLASNKGSDVLPGVQQKAWIYTQNDASLPGYNPNEEHALIQAGTAYALRDDLNITSGPNYSSAPFVLVEYIDTDSRPSMRPFKVLREDPANNYTFNYTMVVGDNGGLAPKLNAPAPLPALYFAGQPKNPMTRTNVNTEVIGLNLTSLTTSTASAPLGRSAVSYVNANLVSSIKPSLVTYRSYALAGYSGGNLFTNFWVYLTTVDPNTKAGVGLLSINKPLLVTATGCVQPTDATANAGRYRFCLPTGSTLAQQQNVQVCNSLYRSNWVGTVTALGVSTNGMNYAEINFGIASAPSTLPAALQSADTLVPVIGNTALVTIPGGGISWSIQNSLPRNNPNIVWAANGTTNTVANNDFDINKCTYQDRDGNIWFYRGPHDANDNAATIMRFYYKTMAGFYFPVDGNGNALTPATQPAVGTITPYLRAWSPSLGNYAGDPINGNTQSTTVGDDNALGISYSAVWSASIPTMSVAETLTAAAHTLPEVRGQTSVGILYQQSQVLGGDSMRSVILHDPTIQKTFELPSFDLGVGLIQIPNSVQTSSQLGKVFFPKLPPHLVDRFFYDSTVGVNGALVLGGDFVSPGTGLPYIFPNVLSSHDIAYLTGLCSPNDNHYTDWVNAINALSVQETPYAWDSLSLWQPNTNSPLVTTYGPGDICQALHQDLPVDSYALSAIGPGTGYVTLVMQGGASPAAQKSPISIYVIQVTPNLFKGEVKVVADSNPLSPYVTLQHVVDLAGQAGSYVFDWWIAAPVYGQAPYLDTTSTNLPGTGWLQLSSDHFPDQVRATLGGTADYISLSDNWITARYMSTDPNNPTYGQWSSWTDPRLAEGWIKRVLAGVNPFNQRVTDLLNNSVNDQVSMLTQAGSRWEGNVALNQDTLNDYGLISIYETLLNMGRNLSIDSGVNYGPANDALLLAAGYLSDLYTILGNEAWAEANNTTVSVGKDSPFSSTATALFPFLGETATILEQQQDLLRGRNDFQTPGVRIAPVYNRLYWNYTRGINSGEIIYALNFDIKPAPGNTTGSVGASDAEYMFPQGHGDAYGHYLTALFNYYKLLMNPNFSWVPAPEAVNVLGVPVLVNYMHERKFAQSAAAMARSGQLIFDLAWRSAYVPGTSNGWAHLGQVIPNTNVVVDITKISGDPARYSHQYWAADHWACRLGQGEYFNWVVGNSMLPAVDLNPLDFGIQKVDRTTVLELNELPGFSQSLQNGMDNAEAHLNPLGLPENTVSFDINPNLVVGASPQPHFEQLYSRSVQALDNAVYAFNQVENVTQALRSQQDSLSDYVNQINAQEQAYTNQLIAIFGAPYADDIGVGKTYVQNYAGPDLVHYMYVDQTDLPGSTVTLGLVDANNKPLDPFVAGVQTTYAVPTWTLPSSYLSWLSDFNNVSGDYTSSTYDPAKNFPTSLDPKNGFLSYTLNSERYIQKPTTWKGSRSYTGKIQQAIIDYKLAWWKLYTAVDNANGASQDISQKIANFESKKNYLLQKQKLENAGTGLEITATTIETAAGIYKAVSDRTIETVKAVADEILTSIPTDEIFGLSDGGDILSELRGAVEGARDAIIEPIEFAQFAVDLANQTTQAGLTISQKGLEIAIRQLDVNQELYDSLQEVITEMNTVNDVMTAINVASREVNGKYVAVQTAITEGNQLLATRQSFRAREAAIIQGYRTRDAAYRLFQNEKLERFNTLFDLAQRYALLSAYAYDYDTGLLGSKAGQSVVQQIVSTRSLGIVDSSGNPQYGGSSSSGDPGLSSVLAAMWADWSVLKGRLGFNNPDGYGTTVSLRSENFRILPGTDGDSAWQDVLNRNRTRDLLADPDVKAYCLQINKKDGLPVPGIVIPFSTTVANGLNLFGKLLAPGDHNYSESSFATKIFSVGVALEGYVGMDTPSANSGGVGAAGGTTVSDPTVTFTDPNGLAATPYVYLIPVGVDSMRSPPLGDVSTVRTWNVADVAIPMPFNIGDSGFSTKPLWQSSDSLQEPLYQIRKHQAFRPVPSASYFSTSIYSGASLARSQYSNTRLIGRSVWNSQWKLVIPGNTLLSDANGGLDRFINSVKDVKLNFVTYSYSGN